ncbi:MAG: hypothetical protein ACR2H1_06760 [Limisphaerales bacterium]
MSQALDWLKGRSVTKVEKKDFSWFFTFVQGGSIATESFWRLITPERLAVASGDHGQLFGLKEPVDAAKCVMSAIEGKTIIDYSCSDVCSDLILCFENEIQLQFLTTSGGYESWRAIDNNVGVFCCGGGRLSKCNLIGNKWVQPVL